jgi:hypothetical protein
MGDILETQVQAVAKDEALRIKFRRDYKFLRFYLLPFLSDFSADVRWMVEKVGVNVEQAFEYQDLLLETGYWVRLSNGGLSAKANYAKFKQNFDDFLNTAEFMTLNANISSRLTDNGQCWYETFTICSTKELETEFIGKLDSLLKEFRTKSEQASGDLMVSWSQIYTHALNGTNANKEVQQ